MATKKNIIINSTTKTINDIIIKKASDPSFSQQICYLKDNNNSILWENHSSGSWITTVAHTNKAGDNGTRIKQCTRCGIQTTSELIPHDWNYSYNTSATLAADGGYNRTCSLCSRNESDTSKGGFVVNVKRGSTSPYWQIIEPERIYLSQPYTSIGTLTKTIEIGVRAPVVRDRLTNDLWYHKNLPSSGNPYSIEYDGDIVLKSSNFESWIGDVSGFTANRYLLWTITALYNVTVNRTYNLTILSQ